MTVVRVSVKYKLLEDKLQQCGQADQNSMLDFHPISLKFSHNKHICGYIQKDVPDSLTPIWQNVSELWKNGQIFIVKTMMMLLQSLRQVFPMVYKPEMLYVPLTMLCPTAQAQLPKNVSSIPGFCCHYQVVYLSWSEFYSRHEPWMASPALNSSSPSYPSECSPACHRYNTPKLLHVLRWSSKHCHHDGKPLWPYYGSFTQAQNPP